MPDRREPRYTPNQCDAQDIQLTLLGGDRARRQPGLSEDICSYAIEGISGARTSGS